MQDINAQQKFDTCKYRSPEEIEKVIQRCACRGGNYTEKGFMCEKKELFQISPDVCKGCEEYIDKQA